MLECIWAFGIIPFTVYFRIWAFGNEATKLEKIICVTVGLLWPFAALPIIIFAVTDYLVKDHYK